MSGRRRKGRDVHGIVLLDKRRGISSNTALQEVKRLFNANKAGHTGSLDPLATGLLPICFGEATKVSAYLLDTDKRYRAVIRLGIVTDSGDMEGRVLQTAAVPDLDLATVAQNLKSFVGDIEQIPPMFSALKFQGKRLYELARAGQVVERAARRVRILELRAIALAGELLSIEVLCSKGTYVRTLAEDIGVKLGCGAAIAELRRLQVGQFGIEAANSIDLLRTAAEKGGLLHYLLPVDRALEAWPPLNLDNTQATHLRQGRRVNMPQHAIDGPVRLYAPDGFVGIGEIHQGKLVPVRIFNVQYD
ncbi:MAG: tRNA pseudouridine(55) synthase TruB [Gammaproteobacteria bacterium]